MPRATNPFTCTACEAGAPQWVGRCPACGGWNTLVEVVRSAAASAAPQPIGRIATDVTRPEPTGIGEVDRVLGGGLVPGSVTLVGGEPGVGKSTLLLQVLARLAASQRCLLVAAEESPQQVRLRAERLETVAPDLWLVAETDLAAVINDIDQIGPRIVVIDSIQAIADAAIATAAGSVTQVRHCAQQLARLSKERTITTVLVGHVTKDGTLAGPRVLEHLVDTVLSFTGDRHHSLRLLRAVKHRFGSTAEVGLFEMGEGGLEGLADAGHLFLADRQPGVAGSVVTPTLDGHRPLLVELQSLVARAPQGCPPRRSTQGVDASRLALLLAVIDRRAGLRLPSHDVYAMAAGGARVNDPGADLALALAIASSACGQPVAADLVACGEVGLGGELRQVPQLARRLAEAARLGFRTAIVPASCASPVPGLTILPATTLREALAAAGIERRRPATVATNNR
ncbi:MAG: DNA repair protein RadA [Acidimicrobiales bacterium]